MDIRKNRIEKQKPAEAHKTHILKRLLLQLQPLKAKVTNQITNIKNKAQNGAQKFKKNFYEVKNKPISKQRSLFLGFTTVVGIFGITLLAPVLPAFAKDNIPSKKPNPGPGAICPAPSPNKDLVPSQKIVSGLAGAAATICALAVGSGSFLIGAACGVIVVIGILKAQGK